VRQPSPPLSPASTAVMNLKSVFSGTLSRTLPGRCLMRDDGGLSGLLPHDDSLIP
jgi:hypothetical protein